MLTSPPRSTATRFGAATIVAFVGALAIIALGGWQIVRTRAAVIADAERNIAGQSHTLAQHAERTIELVDLALEDAVERIEDGQAPDKLARFLHRRANELKQMLNFIVADAEGDWTIDTAAPHSPQTSADRPYFQWHRDHDDAGLHIDAPLIGRTSGRTAIPFSRRINAPNGTFGGLVVSTVSPDYFEDFYRTLGLSDQGTICLWGNDGRMLARYPPLPHSKSLPSTPFTELQKVFAERTGLMRSVSPLDGVERLFAFENVGAYPLVVSVAVSIDTALAGWRRQAAVEGAAFAAAALCLVVLGFGLERTGRSVRTFQQSADANDRKYRILAENASDLVTLKPSFASSRSYVSPSSLSMVGWSPDELQILPIEDFIHADDFERVASEFATLTASNPKVTSLHRVRHKAGHHIWLESVFRLTGDGDVIVSGRDVTARRQVEQSLAESEARFRQLADASSDMIQQLDLDGRRLYVSPAAREIFGFDAAEMTGTKPVDFIHQDDAGRVGGLIGDLAAGHREQARSIHRIRHKMGHLVWVETQFRLVRDRDIGRPVEIVSSVRDVTQREGLRQELEGANRLLLMAEEIGQVGHWRVNLTTQTSTWSREVFRIHGRDPATFTPDVETAISCYHPDDRAEVSRCVKEAIIDRRSYSFEARLLLPDGAMRHVLSRGVCEIDGGGDLTAIFGTIMDVTDLRQAERAAKDSEQRYRLLADNSSDMITHMSLTGQRLFVSPGSRDLLGYEPEDLVGTNPQQMIHPDDADGLKKIVDDLANGSRDGAVTVNRLQHSDGRWIWVEASLKTLRGEDGQPVGLVAAIRNIMERRRADEAMRESEARYRLLADHSGDLIALTPSFLARQAYVSPSSTLVVGYDPDAYAVLPPSELIHPDDYPRVAAEFASLGLDTPSINSVHRVRHKAGHWIWLDVEFRLTSAGQPDQSVIIRARDVTARRRAELALAASEARYRILAETTSDVITQLDLSLHRQYVSPSCRKMLGYDPHEMLGTRPSATIHPDDVNEVRHLAGQLAAGAIEGDRVTATYRTQHSLGHWVWIEAAINLVRDESTGQPASLICSLRDVTERQEVARHLQEAKAAAEQAALAKSEFVANMSHELRTPLTGILGVHDLLATDPSLGPSQKRLIRIASEAGRSLLSIVNDVLDFSKIDANQMAIDHISFDLDAAVTSCCALAREGIGDKPVQIVAVSSPARLGQVLGDPARLRQIILNLLTNAVKFTPIGDIALSATFSEELGLLRIDVTDSGIGIPADRIDALFERFTQADSTITRQYGGTGLGLAICRRLVELMGGRIGVDCPAAGGSHFWFELPLKRHVAPAAVQRPQSVPVRGPARQLLLAEDNMVNAEIIGAMLESCGHRVSIVSDGASAVAAVRQQSSFDLILMDVQMPVMDGLSATVAIRRLEAETGAPRTPIIGLTANAMIDDVERCLAAGMDAHVAKPVDWPSLFATLDRLLGPMERLSPDSTTSATVGEVLERNKLDELARLIGRDKLANMLARFIDDLPSRLTLAGSGGSRELSSQMHILVSTSGQLGFHELSGLCAEIHHAARNGQGLDRLADLRRASERAVEALSASGFGKVA